MMYPRLFLAKNLLKDNGVIFVSIDDNEVHNLRMILNEIFWEENFVGNIDWESKTKSQNTKDSFNKLQPKVEHILLYTKKDCRRFNLIQKGEKQYPEHDEKGTYREYPLEVMDAEGMRGRETMVFEINGILPPQWKQWKRWKDTIAEYNSRWDLIIRNEKIVLKMRPEDEKAEITHPFWWLLTKEIWTAESAKKELSETLGDKKHWFETVKPVELIKRLIFHSTSLHDIILDFFAWSWTTGHAVMDINAEDWGNRKFILVQYPELTDEASEAYKAWYKKISDICKERIRKAGKKIKAAKWLMTETLDIGFKAFVVNESNFKVRRPEEINDQTLISQLDLFTNNTKDGTDKLSMLYELMLKRWIDLNTKVAPSTFEKYSYYYLGDGELVVCLDGKVDQKLMDHIIWLDNLQMVVMLDKAFEWNDQLLSNTNLQMKAKEITFQTL